MCDDIVVLSFCNFIGYKSHLGTSESTLYESTDKSYNTFFYGRLSQAGWVKLTRNLDIYNLANIRKMELEFYSL